MTQGQKQNKNQSQLLVSHEHQERKVFMFEKDSTSSLEMADQATYRHLEPNPRIWRAVEAGRLKRREDPSGISGILVPYFRGIS